MLHFCYISQESFCTETSYISIWSTGVSIGFVGHPEVTGRTALFHPLSFYRPIRKCSLCFAFAVVLAVCAKHNSVQHLLKVVLAAVGCVENIPSICNCTYEGSSKHYATRDVILNFLHFNTFSNHFHQTFFPQIIFCSVFYVHSCLFSVVGNNFVSSTKMIFPNTKIKAFGNDLDLRTICVTCIC